MPYTYDGDLQMSYCGAQYALTYVTPTLAVSDCNPADCQICGQEMASWEGPKKPIYTLKQHSIAGPQMAEK